MIGRFLTAALIFSMLIASTNVADARGHSGGGLPLGVPRAALFQRRSPQPNWHVKHMFDDARAALTPRHGKGLWLAEAVS